MNNIIFKFLQNILWHMPKAFAHKVLYFLAYKKKLNLRNPIDFDEKIQWLLVNVLDDRYKDYVDKVKVREYVKKKGLGETLIPVYGVWENCNDIDLSKLPNEFVLKANHGSGPDYYSIVFDANDKAAVQKSFDLLNSSLKKNFCKHACEYQYKNIKPLVYAEELLHSDSNNKRVNDYKFYCFHGKPYCVLTMLNRDQGEAYFDLDYQLIPGYLIDGCEKEAVNTKKPENFDKMIEIARILSEDFTFARIDLYNIKGKIYFGEITLSPAGGRDFELTDKAQKELGSLLDLSELKRGS